MMNVNSVYTGLVNLAGRKTVSGLITFNNIDGVLFLQKHFQQNITKAPMWLSVEVMSLLASVKLTAQEASKLLKAHKGEMFSAASLFLLRSGLDVNKIVKLATNFHSYPENEGAIDLDETYMDFETYEKLPTIAKGYSKKIQKIVADLYSRYKPGMTEKSYIRSTRAHILNWVRYAIFQPSVEDCGSMVVFALDDNRYIIDSIERRKMLEDSAIKALIAKLASQHKLYVSLSLEAEFNLSLDSGDFMSRSSHPEWNTLFNFADDFYIDTGARVSRVLP